MFVVFRICMVYYFFGTDDDGISIASFEFCVKELHLLQNHHNDILLGRALTGDVINASQKLLPKQFPDIGSLQLTYYNDPRNFLVLMEFKYITLPSPTGLQVPV